MRITESQLRRVVKKLIAEQVSTQDPVTYLAEILYDNSENLPISIRQKIFWAMDNEAPGQPRDLAFVAKFINQKGGVKGFLDWMKGHVTPNQHAVVLSKLRNIGRPQGGEVRGTPWSYNPLSALGIPELAPKRAGM